MRRAIWVAVIVFFFVFVLFSFIRPAIIFFVKQQLKNICVGSAVNVNSCKFNPFRLVSLIDVEIKKEPIYAFKFKEAIIQYSPFSILRGNILKLCLNDASLVVDLGQGSIFELSKHFNLKSGKTKILLNALEFSGLSLNLKSSDLGLSAEMSVALNLINQTINYLNLTVYSLRNKGFQLSNFLLRTGSIFSAGSLHIERIKYEKFNIENIKSSATLVQKYLFLDALYAEFLKGKIRGNVSLKLDRNGEYSAELEFRGLDLEILVEAANMEEKAQISGRLDGRVFFGGGSLNINLLKGDFAAIPPGGVLTIRDNDYLKKIARNSNQSLDIIVESFKNYHYNNGMLKSFLDKGNLILDITLEGEAGKRDLNITVHDFVLTKEKR